MSLGELGEGLLTLIHELLFLLDFVVIMTN